MNIDPRFEAAHYQDGRDLKQADEPEEVQRCMLASPAVWIAGALSAAVMLALFGCFREAIWLAFTTFWTWGFGLFAQ